MIKISSISDDARQSFQLSVTGKDRATLTIEYVWNQRSWVYSLQYKNFSTSNELLVASPNLLRQYRNIIPFGLMCTTENKLDPMVQDSFSSGVASLYYMTADDLAAMEADLYG